MSVVVVPAHTPPWNVALICPSSPHCADSIHAALLTISATALTIFINAGTDGAQS